MTTIDIHAHLLNPNVKFDRLFDKISIKLFGGKLGIEDKKLFLKNPYEEYKKLFLKNIRESKYVSSSVIFPVDSKYNNNGQILHTDKTVCSNNEDLFDFAKTNPDEIIPFFSINPLREDALDKIDEYFEKGFKGAKFLQNYWNINSNDERYIPYYEKLKRYNLPIIIHTGSEYTIESTKAFEAVKMVDLPVEMGINTVAAHMGLGLIKTPYFWKNFSTNPKYFDKQYFELLERLETKKNLYADLSALIHPLRARILPHLSKQNKSIQEKIMFGTDFPVPFTTLTTYDIPFPDKMTLEKIKNPLDRYIEVLLQYFDINSPMFNNYQKILNLK